MSGTPDLHPSGPASYYLRISLVIHILSGSAGDVRREGRSEIGWEKTAVDSGKLERLKECTGELTVGRV